MVSAPGLRDQRAPDNVPPVPARPASARAAGGAVVGLPPAQGMPAPAAEDRPTGGVLVIGREIEVKGEINSCQTLVVEGRLEAAVEVGSLQLAEDGLFNGSAVINHADIAGRFQGELTVRGELLLRPTARVDGKIRYGRVVIEGGGEISGDVKVLPADERAPGTASA